MLYLLLSLVVLLPTLAGVGRLSSRYFPLWGGISADLVGGIFSISILWTLLAFFIPIGAGVEGVTLSVGIFLFIYYKQYRDFVAFFKRHGKVFGLVLLSILFFSAFAPFILDHFGYYVPSILWIREIGLVKGIANLDLLLGQMSVWHILQAGFSHFSDSFLRLNAVLLVVYLFYLIEKKNYTHLVFFPILFLFLQSPSPDLPVIILSLILVNEIFSKNQHLASLFLIACFIFMIKPTAIWVIILTCLYGFLHLKGYALRWIWAGGLLLILFVFKNIWLFGYPIFPMAVADLQVDWKPNALLMQDSAQIAIQKTYDMQYSYEEIQQFSKWEYVRNWFLLEGIKSKINFLFVLGLGVFALYSVKSKSRIIFFIFVSVFIKSIAVLLFSAQYRFFLEVFFVIFFAIAYQRLPRSMAFLSFLILSLGVGIMLVQPKIVQKYVPSFYVGNFIRGIHPEHWLKPTTYRLHRYKTHQVGNLRFSISENYPLMFDTPPPTISREFVRDYLKFGIFPQQYTNNIRDGFYWRPLTEAEKRQVEAILEVHSQEKNPKK